MAVSDSLAANRLRRISFVDRWWTHNEYDRSEIVKIPSAADDGASATSERFATAEQIISCDDERWYVAWSRAASINVARADCAASRGIGETAKRKWLRAANCYRAAELSLPAGDGRRSGLLDNMERCSRHYLMHLEPKGEVVQIANRGGSSIHGYFVRGSTGREKTPAVICFGALNVFKDELLQNVTQYAMVRNLSLLLIDLPGNGVSACRGDEVVTRENFESAASSCFDYLVKRGDVDENRIVLYGEGFGGTYASRSASMDHRFAAAVCDGGIWYEEKKSFSVEWLSGSGGYRDARKSKRFRLARKMRCPFLVVVGDDETPRSEVAIELLEFCMAAGIQMDLLDVASDRIQETGRYSTAQERIFDWIATKIGDVANSRVVNI
jgi:Esterase FrsA-like